MLVIFHSLVSFRLACSIKSSVAVYIFSKPSLFVSRAEATLPATKRYRLCNGHWAHTETKANETATP